MHRAPSAAASAHACMLYYSSRLLQPSVRTCRSPVCSSKLDSLPQWLSSPSFSFRDIPAGYQCLTMQPTLVRHHNAGIFVSVIAPLLPHSHTSPFDCGAAPRRFLLTSPSSNPRLYASACMLPHSKHAFPLASPSLPSLLRPSTAGEPPPENLHVRECLPYPPRKQRDTARSPHGCIR